VPVVDASVVLKRFVDEPDSALALAVRGAHIAGESPIVAPDLLIYEVGNALLHNSRFPEHDIERALSSLYDLQLELVMPTAELAQVVVRLATRYELTFYDALYRGLAQELDMELITADRRLYHRVSPLAVVRLLGS
jgi:predicted nucleic acid-binding protein